MILSFTEVLNLLKNKTNKVAADLAATKSYHELCDKHVSGIKWLETIKKIEYLNNAEDIEILKEIASPQTPGLFEKFRKQYSKIFRAEGFYQKVIFSETYNNQKQDATTWLNQEFMGKGIRAFMQTKWDQWNAERPGDLLLVDLPQEPSTQPNPIVNLIALERIHAIKQVGKKVIWVIIKTEKKVGDEKFTEYRYIDSTKDMVLIERNGNVTIKVNANGEPDIIPNRLGYVPAIRVGQVSRDTYSETVIVNHYYHGLMQADKMQDRCNDHDLTAKKHNFPLFYSYPVVCGTCKGKKEVLHGEDMRKCRKCNGTGEMEYSVKDSASGIRIKMPRDAGIAQPIPNIPTPAGYVTRDNGTIELQRELKQDVREEIEMSVMGVIGLIDRNVQSTATEELINYQPVLDRLYSYSKSAEYVEYFLSKAALDYRYNTTLQTIDGFVKRFEDIIVKYGTTYNLKTENEWMLEFADGKKNGVIDSELKETLKMAIVAKYDNHPEEKERQLLLLELTPFPTYTVRELQELQIGTSDQLGIKVYFNDIIEEIERELEAPITSMGDDISAIRAKMLETYKKLIFVEAPINTQPNGSEVQNQ